MGSSTTHKAISFKFDGESAEQLDTIRRLMKAKTGNETIRRSLNLASVLLTLEEQGGRVLVQTADGTIQQLLIV